MIKNREKKTTKEALEMNKKIKERHKNCCLNEIKKKHFF